ncbi:putative lipid II flippase FtsW [Pontiella sulfatireligans]|uniref:Probable peptidoglycan glycosyltransferase FtsW n=1 Tax=Pontiella sulfatireligans TaxID=2750658 RepID=A0A6C2ULD2_9BACT|nr:putative lipid II flippase FtsW [Pontiella sulfatireligans]VGO21052.1 putative peptidoglycan glycosyltransferase FtsW [Pontiella sulfatireligans]
MRRTISLFIAIVLILVTLGIIMLASASSVKYEDASYFWRHQLVWLALSFFVACVAARFDYRHYRRLVIPLAAVAVVLLILVRIPGIGHNINGSWRWLRIGPLTVQPSEISKVAIIMLFAWWLARNQRRVDEFKLGILIPFGMLACFALPIIVEPDFGTTMLVSAVAVSMMFLGGVSVAPLLIAGLLGLMGVVFLIFQNPERTSRILAFLDPQKYEQDKAWQLINSLRAFAGGDMFGLGFGNSMQKYHYLPEAHTDFIFPIIGEELGLVASLAVVLMYIILFTLGLKIAFKARDDFGRLLAFGITLMITIQALINFAVVTGCVPTKGLALPFISYGGSSLVISGLMIGILVNVAHTSLHGSAKAPRNPFKDRARKV